MNPNVLSTFISRQNIKIGYKLINLFSILTLGDNKILNFKEKQILNSSESSLMFVPCERYIHGVGGTKRLMSLKRMINHIS